MHTQNRVVQSARVRRANRQPVAVTRANREVGSRWRAAAVLMTMGCAAASARAEQSWFAFEAGIGGSAYSQASDGLWLQEGFPHHVKLTAPAVEAGITGDLYRASRWGISYHVDYAWLGTIHSTGHATSDANYNLATKKERVSMPLANFTGSGHDMGFLATIEPHYDYAGWRFGVEGGPYFHKPTWTVDATNQVNYIGQTPYHTHFVDEEGWHLGYVLGASVAYKRFSLRYQYFANGSKTGNPIPVLWTHTHVLTANYTF